MLIAIMSILFGVFSKDQIAVQIKYMCAIMQAYSSHAQLLWFI